MSKLGKILGITTGTLCAGVTVFTGAFTAQNPGIIKDYIKGNKIYTSSEMQEKEKLHKAEVTDLNKEIVNITASYETVQSALNQEKAKVYDLEKSVADLSATKTANEETIATLTSSNTDLQSQVTALTNEVTTKQATVTSLESQIEINNTRIAELEAQGEENAEEIAELQEMNTELNTQVSILNTEIETKTIEITTLNTTISTQETTIANLTNENTTLNTTIENLNSEISIYENKVENLESQLYSSGVMTSGLYDDSGIMSYSWDDLISSGAYTVTDGTLKTDRKLTEYFSGNLIIDSSVTTISEDSFYKTNLKKVFIPSSVEIIGRAAFCNSSLENVFFEENSKIEILDREVFAVTKIKSITIPASVVRISAVGSNPDYVTKGTQVYTGAFYSCKSLESVKFEEGSKLEIIGLSAFNFCQSLKTFDMPAGVKQIWNYAFNLCPLEYLVIPPCIEFLQRNAFGNLKGSLVLTNLPPVLGDGLNADSSAPIYVRKDCKTEFEKVSNNWLEHFSSVEYYDDISTVFNTLGITSSENYEYRETWIFNEVLNSDISENDIFYCSVEVATPMLDEYDFDKIFVWPGDSLCVDGDNYLQPIYSFTDNRWLFDTREVTFNKRVDLESAFGKWLLENATKKVEEGYLIGTYTLKENLTLPETTIKIGLDNDGYSKFIHLDTSYSTIEISSTNIKLYLSFKNREYIIYNDSGWSSTDRKITLLEGIDPNSEFGKWLLANLEGQEEEVTSYTVHYFTDPSFYEGVSSGEFDTLEEVQTLTSFFVDNGMNLMGNCVFAGWSDSETSTTILDDTTGVNTLYAVYKYEENDSLKSYSVVKSWFESDYIMECT